MGTDRSANRYWAFISYSNVDAAMACRLHRRLETYRIPRDLIGRPGRDEPVPRRIFPIFHDRSELPLSADLGASIEDALRASRYLIVLCSPESAKSRWVNEEVRYFKSLGREDRVLAIMIRGEPNASDVPGRADEECFAPALRHRIAPDGRLTDQRAEPIAGDLRKGGDGWRNAFLKAVAGITGLGFDAFAKRQAKRERRKRLIAAACLLTLLVAGVWTWDFNRLKVAYYANTTTRWGVPEGVGPLSAELRAGRETHYRFESRRGKVRRVLRMNSVGELRDDPEAYDASEIRIIYLPSGELNALVYSNNNGRLTARLVFAPCVVSASGDRSQVFTTEGAQGGAITQSATQGVIAGLYASAVTNNKSDVTGSKVIYEDNGLAIAVHFQNALGFPRANADGIFGKRLVYGELGVPIEISYLDSSGELAADRTGVAKLKQLISPLGDILGTSYLTLGHLPWQDAYNVSEYKRTLDRCGNVLAIECLDSHGMPTLHRNGYAKIIKSYDSRGNIASEAYFGTDANPRRHDKGYASVGYKCDDQGNVIERAHFDKDGSPTAHMYGYSYVRSKYDENGNLVEEAYYGKDGEPKSDIYGACIRKYEHDSRGNLIRIRYFDVNGSPSLNWLGCAERATRYDVRDNPVETRYFGIDGQPIAVRNGYSAIIRTYDERNNISEIAFHHNNMLCNSRNGYARVAFRYNERGGVVEEAYYDSGGLLALNTDGFARSVRTYDKYGNITGFAMYDKEGLPACFAGLEVHKIHLEYNDQGEEILRQEHRRDGSIIE